jgi:hypothetical protein
MKIVIDNPCHENWDAMTPNEKGAFCLSCQKTVIDFSVKTVEEIRNFFVELPKTESVCGRFNEEQLEEISFEHFFTQFKKWKYFHKAAVIAFFIFGFSLFGNAQVNHNPERMMLKGEVAYIAPKDTIKKKPIVKDPIKAEPPVDIQTMGGARYIPDQHEKDQPKKEKLMGKPNINRDPH